MSAPPAPAPLAPITAQAAAPSAPPTAPSPVSDNEHALLLAYLRARDLPCPRCGRNLRGMRTASCPHCTEPLALALRWRRTPLAIFIALLTPSLFSAICTGLIGGFIVCGLVINPNLKIPRPWIIWQPYSIGLFGLTSAAAGGFLFRHRELFFRRSLGTQVTWALAAWAIHVGTFILAILMVNGYI